MKVFGLNLKQQIYVRVFAGVGFGIGNVFGKQGQATLGGFTVQYAAEFSGQCVIQLERAEFARCGGDMVDGFAVVQNVQTAQMADVGKSGQIVLKTHRVLSEDGVKQGFGAEHANARKIRQSAGKGPIPYRSGRLKYVFSDGLRLTSGRLACTENFIAGIAQAGNDIAVFVQMAVEGGGINGNVGVGFVNQFHAFGRGNQHQRFDIAAAFLLQ